jgi:HEPN domain-containing protein
MKNEKTIRKWILLADGDFKTANDELITEDPITTTICFHSQQCIEKYLKAYLTLVAQSFGKLEIFLNL